MSLEEETDNEYRERWPVWIDVLGMCLIPHLIVLLDKSVGVQFPQIDQQFDIVGWVLCIHNLQAEMVKPFHVFKLIKAIHFHRTEDLLIVKALFHSLERAIISDIAIEDSQSISSDADQVQHLM